MKEIILQLDWVRLPTILGAAIHQPKGAASVDYVARSNLARLRARVHPSLAIQSH
jgi:hypothetical protein